MNRVSKKIPWIKIFSLTLSIFLLSNCFYAMRKIINNTRVFPIAIHGKIRRYILHLPKNYDPTKKVPLILVLHGGGGNGNGVEIMTGFSKKSDEEGFIVAYPYGTGRFDELFLTWNSGNCCGYALDNNTDDVEYIRQLILFLKNQYLIAEGKVFVTGMSNGAMMSYILGCKLSTLINGIAPVSGAMNTPFCNPENPVSVILFHGKKDQHVPYYGGKPIAKVDPHSRTDASVKHSEEFWRDRNECTDKKIVKVGNVERITYKCAKAGLSIISIDNEGHTWPGGKRGYFGADVPTTEISATNEMFKFWMSL